MSSPSPAPARDGRARRDSHGKGVSKTVACQSRSSACRPVRNSAPYRGLKQQDRYDDRALRLRNRKALKAHLTTVLKLFGDPVCAVDAMDWLVGHHRGSVDAAMYELRAFEDTAQRLLDGAVAFDPGYGRTGRGELQLRTELTLQAFFELIETLESVGVPVPAYGKPRDGRSHPFRNARGDHSPQRISVAHSSERETPGHRSFILSMGFIRPTRSSSLRG